MKMDRFEDELESQPILERKNHTDWETFKKLYYSQENQINVALESLSKLHSETCKKLAQMGEQDQTLFTEDQKETQIKAHQSELNRLQQKIQVTEEMMGKMSQILDSIHIDPNEAQIKYKQNFLKRFKEIHLEHMKELSRIRSSYEYNVNKYNLFKESFNVKQTPKSQLLDQSEIRFNGQLNRAISQTDTIIEMARNLNISFHNQGNRLLGIQHRVSDMIGGFADINRLITQIKRKKLKNQFILILLSALLVIFVLYRIFT